MDSMFLLHKPVIYGSVWANSAFLFVLLGHIILLASGFEPNSKLNFALIASHQFTQTLVSNVFFS